MGRLARVLEYIRVSIPNAGNFSKTKVNRGGDDNRIADVVQPAGIDAVPLPNDYTALMDVASNGGSVAVGYSDPNNLNLAVAGDIRLYSRDENGAQVAEIWIKNTGAIVITSTGTVDINGVTVDAAGAVTIPASLIVAGKELAGHDHPINSGSSAPGPTGPNN